MKIIITKQFQTFLNTIGINIEDVIQKAKLSNKLWQEELSYDNSDYHCFMLTLNEMISDEAVLALSKIDQLQLFIPPFFAALSSPDGFTALKRFARYKHLIGPVDVLIKEYDDLVHIHYQYLFPEIPRMLLLQEQLILVNLLRTGTGECILPMKVASPYVYGESIEREFGISTQKQDDNEIVFAKKDLKKSFITQNNAMWRYLEPSLNQQLSQIEANYNMTQAVQKMLLTAIPSGQYALTTIAEKLGVSARTLQRKLSVENTSFQQEVMSLQKSMAFAYLKLKMSPDDIAYLVGYSEKSSFLRAFKKWTGATLKHYTDKSEDEQ